ncbi:hypothetical protein Taro_031863 [Colocasia esculenta]|uniref:Uncharacterized protein n=1 Tax=Colocasia esculenta TaxID=4460 RepID=A0A843W4E1_COLES|nr:hypothetical protein [Colocasia esculenta]
MYSTRNKIKNQITIESDSKTISRYNQLIGHVGIHGQGSLTEALNKDSLVRQKEYLTKSLSKSRKSVYRNKCWTFQRNSRIVKRW